MPVVPPIPSIGPVFTPLGVIKAALRLINVLEAGEDPEPDDAQDALDTLNSMVDSWNAERLMVYTLPRLVFNLQATKQTYTLGINGDFNTPRPARIELISVITNLNNPDGPLELPIEKVTEYGWAAIPVKSITSTLPQKVWDDNGNPLRNLSYWPIPQINLQTAIYPWTAISQFSELGAQFNFPPGYYRALRYNLALELAPEYGKEPSPSVSGIAVASRAIIKSNNMETLEMACDPAVVGTGQTARTYNWISDQPNSNTY